MGVLKMIKYTCPLKKAFIGGFSIIVVIRLLFDVNYLRQFENE